MNHRLRVQILKDLPRGSMVTLTSITRKGETGIKIYDRDRCMIVLLDDGKMPIRYDKLTCEEIIKSDDVLRRLKPELPVYDKSNGVLGEVHLKSRRSGMSYK